MRISLDTTLKEIIKNAKVKEVCNSVSNGLFANPSLAQAEAMSLGRVAALLGTNGLAIMSAIVDKTNVLLADIPDDNAINLSLEIQQSQGLEAKQTEEERQRHIAVNNTIKPGQVWYDTDGNRIQAHGACVYYENNVYYWIGENKDHTTKEGEIWTWGVKIYSSVDLCNWKDEGYLIEPNLEDSNSVFYPTRRLDRPHILFNKRTGKYVLWLKYCDNAHFTVLTSDSLMGNYIIVHENYHPFDTQCGDFDLAQDETTGQAYLYWEVNHTDVWAARLSDDYTEVAGDYSIIYKNMQPPFAREGISHFMRNGKHYVFSSGMTGYVPNPSEVAMSNDWLTGYTVLGNPHVDDPSCASFNSQISFVLKVGEKDKYIAIADRWVPEFVMTAKKYDVIVRAITSRNDPTVKVTAEEKASLASMPLMGSANTSIANYVWLPIEFDGDMPLIKWHDEWRV